MDGREFLNFASNDYLNLAHHPWVVESAARALQTAGAGAGASRLVTGTLELPLELERRLAAFKQYPAALVFGSGYLANVGIITALLDHHDHAFADRLAHASLLDGIRMSGARLHRFRHNQPGHLADLLAATPPGVRRLVVTESVFSMDGDLAPLPALATVCRTQGAMLLVDEAHATGVFGPGGAGRVRELDLESDVNLAMGTLSKALGGYGGFVACSAIMRDWLVNRARAFIYTTAPPPAALGAALGALNVLEQEPGRGAELLRRAERFRESLRAGGLETQHSASPIIPVMIGDNERALRIAARLRAAGILVVAIRPPTVPPGTARLRFSVTLAHQDGELAWAADTIARIVRETPLA